MADELYDDYPGGKWDVTCPGYGAWLKDALWFWDDPIISPQTPAPQASDTSQTEAT
jgi:hypothetical protein